jgi:hypothetical protein
VQWLVLPVVELAGQGSILGLAPYSGGSPLPVTFKKKMVVAMGNGYFILFGLGYDAYVFSYAYISIMICDYFVMMSNS